MLLLREVIDRDVLSYIVKWERSSLPPPIAAPWTEDNVDDDALSHYLFNIILGERASNAAVLPPSAVASTLRAAVTFDLDAPDPRSRVRAFFQSWERAIRLNRFEARYARDKDAVKLLTSFLKPKEYRLRIEAVIHVNPAVGRDLSAFRDALLNEEGMGYLQGLLRREPTDKKAKHVGAPSSSHAAPSDVRGAPPKSSGSKKRHAGSTSSAGKSAGGGGGSSGRGGHPIADASTSSAPHAATTLSTRPGPTCFKCGGSHAVSACPRASQADKDRLLKAFGEHRRSGAAGPFLGDTKSKTTGSGAAKSSGSISRSGAARSVEEPTSAIVADHDGEISFPGGVTRRYCLDTGATTSFVSPTVVEAIKSAGELPPRAVTVRPTPLRCLLASGDVATASKVLTVDTVITTVAGKCQLRKFSLHIVDSGSSDDVLIGRDLLDTLGLDIRAAFAEATASLAIPDDTAVAEAAGSATAAQQHPRVRASSVRPSWAAPLREAPPEPAPDVPSPVQPVAAAPAPPDDPLRRCCRIAVVEASLADTELHAAQSIDFQRGKLEMDPVLAQLDAMHADAVAEGLPADLYAPLRDLLHEFKHIFRVSLGAEEDRAADTVPLRVHVKEGAVPVSCKPRRYTAEKEKFLDEQVDDFVAKGMLVENPSSRWSSPVHVVAKPCTPSSDGTPVPLDKRFRMVVDLRAVNALVQPMVWPMPLMETIYRRLAGRRFFFTIDLWKGYWQAPLHPDSQEMHSIMTPRGVYTPTRVLHGCTDGTQWFQFLMTDLFRGVNDLHIWLDDLLGAAASSADYLRLLRTVFERLSEQGWKCSAKKCRIFTTSVVWCGRVISAAGVSEDPARIVALGSMPSPTTAADLIQFLAAVNWMRGSIPCFNDVVAPLADIREYALSKAPSRKKTAARRVLLADVGWNDDHERAYQRIKDALAGAVTLAFPDLENRVLCLYTDASDTAWGAVLTQLPPDDLPLAVDEQRHEPLAFLSGDFKGAASRWSTVEKEAFAIVHAAQKLDYLLQNPQGFRIFTDHANLAFIFDASRHSALHRHTAAKLQRWALQLTGFDYVIEHIPGELNVWADLLSRWGATPSPPPVGPDPLPARAAAAARPQRAVDLPPPPLVPLPVSDMSSSDSSSDRDTPSDADVATPAAAPSFNVFDSMDVDWELALDEQHLRDAQEQFLKEGRAPAATGNNTITADDADGLLKTRTGRVFVPDGPHGLRLRLCVLAHQALGGHRGQQATIAAVSSRFWWPTLRPDIRLFCKACLHCVVTRGGNRVPRPLANALHAAAPRDILHFDFLFVARRSAAAPPSSPQYLLILRDDFSSYTEAVPCAAATAEATACALLDYFSRHGVVKTWVSDQGSHFLNTVVAELASSAHAHHHFVTAYSPWANGTIERANRDILSSMRALASEYGFQLGSGSADIDRWPSLVPVIVHSINASPSERLGNLSPSEVFSGVRMSTPLDAVFHPDESALLRPALNDAERLSAIRDAAKRAAVALDTAVRTVRNSATAASRRRAGHRRDRRTGVQAINFGVGDFVLVAFTEKRRQARSKLVAAWHGPYRVVAPVLGSVGVFQVEHLISGATSVVHAARLRFYADRSLRVTSAMKDILSRAEMGAFTIDTIVAWRRAQDAAAPCPFELQIRWLGFDDAADSWEPLDSVAADVPALCDDFVRRVTDVPARREMLHRMSTILA